MRYPGRRRQNEHIDPNIYQGLGPMCLYHAVMLQHRSLGTCQPRFRVIGRKKALQTRSWIRGANTYTRASHRSGYRRKNGKSALQVPDHLTCPLSCIEEQRVCSRPGRLGREVHGIDVSLTYLSARVDRTAVTDAPPCHAQHRRRTRRRRPSSPNLYPPWSASVRPTKPPSNRQYDAQSTENTASGQPVARFTAGFRPRVKRVSCSPSTGRTESQEHTIPRPQALLSSHQV